LTLYHELIHSRLTPKLYALRDLRIAIAQNGYANSHLLRYLEEALCETYALLRGNGFSKQVLVEGIHFPIKNDYTTTALMGKEARGCFWGPSTLVPWSSRCSTERVDPMTSEEAVRRVREIYAGSGKPLGEDVMVQPGFVPTGDLRSSERKTWIVRTNALRRGGNRLFHFDAETGELLKEVLLPR
jgi:hypothetical protein